LSSHVGARGIERLCGLEQERDVLLEVLGDEGIAKRRQARNNLTFTEKLARRLVQLFL
jgi:hypothetical protein